MVRGLRKLRNLGQGYVNFGQPISLPHYLRRVPDWRLYRPYRTTSQRG